MFGFGFWVFCLGFGTLNPKPLRFRVQGFGSRVYVDTWGHIAVLLKEGCRDFGVKGLGFQALGFQDSGFDFRKFRIGH